MSVVVESDPSAAVGELLRPLVHDRTFVVVGAPLRALAFDATELLDLGARHVLVVGDGVGSRLPDQREGLSWRVLDVAGPSFDEARLSVARQLAHLPADVQAAIDAVDPDGEALVLNANNLYTAATVAGRRVLGPARPEWLALEDKTTCLELWRHAGVAQAPFELVPARHNELVGAAVRLDEGEGTVWAGDNHDFVHSGASLTRWVREPSDVEPVAATMAAHCTTVRVMPFLEGIPCSIHGIITVDGVAGLRPCEMLVVRDHSPGHLRFIGMGDAWDPQPDDREDMRDVARRVGAVLRERHGYRGTFSIDGVMTVDGFRPTELNPRVGGGMMLLSAACPQLGLLLHAYYLADGVDTGLRAGEAENAIVTAADQQRMVRVVDMLDGNLAPLDEPIVIDNGRGHAADPTGERHGTASIRRIDTYLPWGRTLEIDPERLPVGSSSAPWIADASICSTPPPDCQPR